MLPLDPRDFFRIFLESIQIENGRNGKRPRFRGGGSTGGVSMTSGRYWFQARLVASVRYNEASCWFCFWKFWISKGMGIGINPSFSLTSSSSWRKGWTGASTWTGLWIAGKFQMGIYFVLEASLKRLHPSVDSVPRELGEGVESTGLGSGG